MKRAKVTIYLIPHKGRANVRSEVDAWDVGVPGLIIHRAYRLAPDGATVAAKGWNVSHVPSGLKVNTRPLDKREDAELLAVMLEPYADWTTSQADLKAGGMTAEFVRNTEAQIRWHVGREQLERKEA